MNVLFLGGNGNISWWCVEEALKKGHTVYELNRGQTVKTRRAVQDKVIKLTADVHDMLAVQSQICSMHFDCVCDFICYNKSDAEERYELFKQNTNQYVFISSESVYKRAPVQFNPFTETSEQCNPDEAGLYIGGKIAAEQFFLQKHTQEGFPLTIVRPGYTYDTIVPVSVGGNCWTVPQHLLAGFPLLIKGSGENLWTFTHSKDFAAAFIGVIGNKSTIGEAYNIMGDTVVTWNEHADLLLDVLGVKNKRIIHIPNDAIMNYNLPQDKAALRISMNNSIFDNSKIKALVPGWTPSIDLHTGLKCTIQWLQENPERRRIVKSVEDVLYQLYKDFANIDY